MTDAIVVMMNPPIVPESWEGSVVVSVACDGDRHQPLRVAARQDGVDVAAADVNSQGGDCSICVSSATIGVVEVLVETVDGVQMSMPVQLLVAPAIVAQELATLFRVSMGEYQQASGGNVEPGELASRTWTQCFHPMIVHVGKVLMCPDDASDAAYNLVTRLLEYFILNKAYQTGQFILSVAAGAGRAVTLNGQPIDTKEALNDEGVDPPLHATS